MARFSPLIQPVVCVHPEHPRRVCRRKGPVSRPAEIVFPCVVHDYRAVHSCLFHRVVAGTGVAYHNLVEQRVGRIERGPNIGRLVSDNHVEGAVGTCGSGSASKLVAEFFEAVALVERERFGIEGAQKRFGAARLAVDTVGGRGLERKLGPRILALAQPLAQASQVVLRAV
jgi:hypothetical protein